MQHVGFPIVKPRFSRLGGSIWELNIDTKRFQEDSGGPWRTERRGEGQQEGEKEVQKQTRGARRSSKRSPRATWRPPKPPKRPPRGVKRSRRDPENALNTIFGGEETIYAKRNFSYSRTKVSEARRVHLGVKHRHEEAPRRLWRSVGHREATRRASRSFPRAPKSRSIEPAE